MRKSPTWDSGTAPVWIYGDGRGYIKMRFNLFLI